MEMEKKIFEEDLDIIDTVPVLEEFANFERFFGWGVIACLLMVLSALAGYNLVSLSFGHEPLRSDDTILFTVIGVMIISTIIFIVTIKTVHQVLVYLNGPYIANIKSCINPKTKSYILDFNSDTSSFDNTSKPLITHLSKNKSGLAKLIISLTMILTTTFGVILKAFSNQTGSERLLHYLSMSRSVKETEDQLEIGALEFTQGQSYQFGTIRSYQINSDLKILKILNSITKKLEVESVFYIKTEETKSRINTNRRLNHPRVEYRSVDQKIKD